MKYGVIGLNHRTAPIAVREQVALNGETLDRALALIEGDGEARECAVLSTCNRVEIYVLANDPERALTSIVDAIINACQLEPGTVRVDTHFYTLWGEPALRHLFKVASSLDSMVLGEPQILGQLKRAYSLAVEAGTIGGFLSRAMHRAFSTAKRVRTETNVGAGGVSVSYVAAQLAAKIFGSLRGRSILLVGAGEMAELAARNLQNHGAGTIFIANRSIERAQALATDLGGIARPLVELPDLLQEADIVITSTGSPQPILHRRTLSGIMRARKFRAIFLIDIAVPRDIEASVGQLDNVYLYDVDDLQHVVSANQKEREHEAQKAQTIVDEEVARFSCWVDQADVIPTVVALRAHFDAIKEAEVERFLHKKLAHLDEDNKELVRLLARSLVNKLTHAPTVNLKHRAAQGVGTQSAVELINDLFGLDV